MPKKIDYYIRIGRFTHEREVLEEFVENYDGLNIPANILAYYSKAFYVLISKIKHSYFIDPQTYVFASRLSNDVVTRTVEIEEEGKKREERTLKKSYDKLLDFYQDSQFLKDTLKNGPLSIAYFNDIKLKDFVNSSLNFQQEILLKESEKSAISKYDRIYAGTENHQIIDQTNIMKPAFLTLPYFYIENDSSPWYKINISILNIAKNYRTDLKKYAVFCLEKTLISNTKFIVKLLSDYQGFDGYIVFISGFDQWSNSSSELKNFKKFIELLHDTYKKPIIHNYGTILSAYLNEIGISCFSSGIYINNSKNIDEEGMGRVKFRYYVPSSHSILNQNESKNYFLKFDPTSECTCNLCEYIKKQKTGNIPQDLVIIDRIFRPGNTLKQITRKSSKHFLINMKKEIDFVNEHNSTEYIERLTNDTGMSNNYSGVVTNSHLRRWIDVIGDT